MNKDILIDLAQKSIEGSDLFLVDVKCSTTNEIEILVDSDLGVDISKCVEISRFIEDKLDRDSEDFELTVASAGISDPLRIVRQYIKHKGKEVEVITKSGEKFSGVMSEVSDSGIVVEYQVKMAVEGKKRKQLTDVKREINYEDMKSVRLVIKFK